MDDREIRLPDGRRLAYRQNGPPDGPVVMFMPGFMACRLSGRQATDARVVTADRPGIGRSDPAPGRTLLTWADDVAALADALGVERFAVLGHSAGAPYAAAVAHKWPERISSFGIACGFAPLDREGATDGMDPRMARGMHGLQRAPWTARLATAGLPRRYRRDPEAAFRQQFGRSLPPCDVAAMAEPSAREMLLAAATESTRQGAKQLAVEMQLTLGRGWGFDVADIDVPTRLWYGADDTLTPPQMGEYLRSQIPGAELVVYETEGHMAAFSHWDEVVGALSTLSR